MAVTAVRAEKAYEKYAWIFLLLVWLAVLPAPAFELQGRPTTETIKDLTGMTFDEVVASQPRIASYIKFALIVGAINWLSLVLSALAITIVPYRKGGKWAWYTLWIAPVSLLALTAAFITAPGSVTPSLMPVLILILILCLLSLLGLLLPYRKFFPKVSATVRA